MLLSLGFWIATHVFYYKVFEWLYARFRPAFVPDCEIQRRVLEVPVRVVALLHAVYTVMYGYGFLLGLTDLDQLVDCRATSSAYLVFDMLKSYQMWQVNKRTKARSSYAHVHIRVDDTEATETGGIGVIGESEETEDKRDVAHPAAVAFHHVTTLAFIHGLLCGQETVITAILLFFCSELPVIFLNLTWLFFHVGRSNTRACAICSNLTVATYCVARLFLFAVVFAFKLLPAMSWLSPWTLLVIALLVFVYALNVVWFAILVKKNLRYLRDLPIFSTLSQLMRMMMGVFGNAHQSGYSYGYGSSWYPRQRKPRHLDDIV